ncbi:MAG: ABC transporter permease subunit, partial [Desulfovibrionales bacterium]
MAWILRSLAVSGWFIFLTFPLMVIRVNTINDVVEWRWMNMLYIGIGSFVLSLVWQILSERRERGRKKQEEQPGTERRTVVQTLVTTKKFILPLGGTLLLLALIFPHLFSTYQTTIMISALIYVVLGLGLNIVVGLAGLLDLGYVAFYAVGAYTYALLNYHFGLGFWTILPLGGLLGALFGILLGIPVLRLRGDYLAIVTLGFGEIIRLILENWNDFSMGPSGISNIDRPGLFGMDLNLHETTIYMYYLMVAMALVTIFVVNRLQNSRIGRAWIALREDEIACQAMGID